MGICPTPYIHIQPNILETVQIPSLNDIGKNRESTNWKAADS